MKTIEIWFVGREPEIELKHILTVYENRLKNQWKIKWVKIPHCIDGTILNIKKIETARILAKMKPTHYYILLDSKGKELNTVQFSTWLYEKHFGVYKNIIFIIGGAYGVDENLGKVANFNLSLSSLTFPHQMVKWILIEQIYRAMTIHLKIPYHNI